MSMSRVMYGKWSQVLTGLRRRLFFHGGCRRSIMKNMLAALLFCLPVTVNGSAFDYSIGLNIGGFHPTSAILKSYFDKSSVFTYGIDVSMAAVSNNIGAYIRFQRFSFNVADPYGDEYVRGHWFTLGLEKAFPLEFVYPYGRLGITLHYDTYDLFVKNLRFGLHSCLGLRFTVTERTKPFAEVGYEYARLSIPDYVELDYTRHQAYLAGEDFQSGGIMMNAGISYKF